MAPLTFTGLDALATAVVFLDLQHVVRYVNPAAENLLAISAKNLVGVPLDKVIADPELLIAAVNYAKENN
jgi:two-component system, NtrC family, nitrogen regulation sensor histidine kinase GlnL